MTDDQLAYAAEFTDRFIFRCRSIGMSDVDIVEMLAAAIANIKERACSATG